MMQYARSLVSFLPCTTHIQIYTDRNGVAAMRVFADPCTAGLDFRYTPVARPFQLDSEFLFFRAR